MLSGGSDWATEGSCTVFGIQCCFCGLTRYGQSHPVGRHADLSVQRLVASPTWQVGVVADGDFPHVPSVLLFSTVGITDFLFLLL